MAIILLLCLSFQSLVKLGVVAWYQVNKTYVAANLCENKDKPAMKCQGKCYLKKQLAKAENDSGRSHKQTNVKIEVVEFIVSTFASMPVLHIQHTTAQNGHYTPCSGCDVAVDIFHPPGFLA